MKIHIETKIFLYNVAPVALRITSVI